MQGRDFPAHGGFPYRSNIALATTARLFLSPLPKSNVRCLRGVLNHPPAVAPWRHSPSQRLDRATRAGAHPSANGDPRRVAWLSWACLTWSYHEFMRFASFVALALVVFALVVGCGGEDASVTAPYLVGLKESVASNVAADEGVFEVDIQPRTEYRGANGVRTQAAPLAREPRSRTGAKLTIWSRFGLAPIIATPS